MNLTVSMIPGIVLLVAGAVVTFGSKQIAGNRWEPVCVQLAGVFLCATGAILVFLLSGNSVFI